MAFSIITIKDNCSPHVSNRFHAKLIKAITNPNSATFTSAILQDHSNVYEQFTIDPSNRLFAINQGCHMIQVDSSFGLITNQIPIAVFPNPTTTRQFATSFLAFITTQEIVDITPLETHQHSIVKHKPIPLELPKLASSKQTILACLTNIDTAVSVLKNANITKWLRSNTTPAEFKSVIGGTWQRLIDHQVRGLIHVFKFNDLKHITRVSRTEDELHQVFKDTLGSQVAQDLLTLASTFTNIFITGGIMNRLMLPHDTAQLDNNSNNIDLLYVEDNHFKFAKLVSLAKFFVMNRGVCRMTNRVTVTCILPCDVPHVKVKYIEPIRINVDDVTRSEYQFKKNPNYTEPTSNSDLRKAFDDVFKRYDPFNYDKAQHGEYCETQVTMLHIVTVATRYGIGLFGLMDTIHQFEIRFVTKPNTACQFSCVVQVEIGTVANSPNSTSTIRFVSVNNTANDRFHSAVSHISNSKSRKPKALYHNGCVYVTPSAVAAPRLTSYPSQHQSVPSTNWATRLGYNIIIRILFGIPTVRHIMVAYKALGIELRTLDLARLLQRRINELYQGSHSSQLIVDTCNIPIANHNSLHIWRGHYTRQDFLVKLASCNTASPIDFIPRQALVTMLDSCSHYVAKTKTTTFTVSNTNKYAKMTPYRSHFETHELVISDLDTTCISFKNNEIAVSRKLGRTLYQLKLSVQNGIPIIQLIKSQFLAMKYNSSIHTPMNKKQLGWYRKWTCLVAHVTSGNSHKGFKHLKYKLNGEASEAHYTCKVQVNSSAIVISCPKGNVDVLDCSIIKLNDDSVRSTHVHQYLLGNKDIYFANRDYTIDYKPRRFILKDNIVSNNFEYNTRVEDQAQTYTRNTLPPSLMLNYFLINLIKYYEAHDSLPLGLCELVLKPN